jgi:hypothetical protein
MNIKDLNNKIKPFRNGDRVVADASLTEYILSDGFKGDPPMTDAPLDDLTYNERKVSGKGVCLQVGLLGAVSHGVGNIVGYILPAPEQPATHEYQFGDKIKLPRGIKARIYLGEIEGMALYTIYDTPLPWHVRTIHNCHLSEIALWPTPLQIQFNESTTIQVDENAVFFIHEYGAESAPLSIIDKLVEARKSFE